MNYSVIRKCDIANGSGVRVSVFVSGCRHHCPGCFNVELWDFCHGKPFTEETEKEIIEALKEPWVKGLSLLGGDPMEPENQRALLPLLRKTKALGNKDIWCYTGFTYAELRNNPSCRGRCEVTEEFLSFVDVLVDGPFIIDQKDISLRFRGSGNQQILKLRNGREALN